MTSIGTWVSRWLPWGRSAESSATEPVDGAYESLRPTAWDNDLELTLSKLVTETETRASGRVQVLTLAHLRSELGDDWTQYQPKVLLIAENTIGRMIGKGNIYIQQDEDSWLLLMPSLTESEAESRADDIARALGEKLVGERFADQEPPLPQTAKVDLSSAINPDGSFNTPALKSAVKRARIGLAVKDAKRASTELEKAKTPSRPDTFATVGSATQVSLFPQLTLTYRPQWDANTQSFSTFVLRAFTDTGEPIFGPGAPEHIQKALNDATIIDLAKAAFADFGVLTHKRLRAIYVVPVPFAVMTRKLGAVFLRALTALPQKERLMHMRIELVNVPASTPISTLADVREMFRGRVRDVAFLTDLHSPQDNVLALDHVSIGGELRINTGASDHELFEQMDSFRRRVGARRCYVMGLRSRALASAAIKSGYDEISGTGIADDIRNLPDQLSVVQKQDLVHAY